MIKIFTLVYTLIGLATVFMGCKSTTSEGTQVMTSRELAGAPLQSRNTCVGTEADIARFARFAAKGQLGQASSVMVDHVFKRHVSGEIPPTSLDRQSWFPNNLARDTLRDFLMRIQFDARTKPKNSDGSYIVDVGFKVGCSAEAVDGANGTSPTVFDTKILKVAFNARGVLMTAFPYKTNPGGWSPGTSPIEVY